MRRKVRLFGAVAVRPAVQAVLARFETATGFTVSSEWDLNRR